MFVGSLQIEKYLYLYPSLFSISSFILFSFIVVWSEFWKAKYDKKRIKYVDFIPEISIFVLYGKVRLFDI